MTTATNLPLDARSLQTSCCTCSTSSSSSKTSGCGCAQSQWCTAKNVAAALAPRRNPNQCQAASQNKLVTQARSDLHLGSAYAACQPRSARCVPMAMAAPAPLKERRGPEAPPSFEYNEKMKKQMANPYEYHHELGMCYTRITSHIIVGSQPQTPDDVTFLKEREGVDVVLNLQEDRDVAYWGVDLPAIQRRCRELSVEHTRQPAVDFDAHSLRRQLPAMVAVLARAVAQGKTVYVHCTAGLGRSPAAVIAYLFWFGRKPRPMNLQTAYDLVTSKRPCGPKWDAIRGATYDLAKDSPYQPRFESLPPFAFSDVAQWERDLIQQRVMQAH